MSTSFLRNYRLLFLFSSALLVHSASATHIVGGDLGYSYLGETAPGTGEYRYKLILRLFVNCGPSSSFPSVNDIIGSDAGLPVGIYADDPGNPGADKARISTATVHVTAYGIITPDLPPGCNVGDGQCVEESRLEGEVVLGASDSGFHLYLQLFARNEAIDNLVDPGGTGMGFYSYIPPTAINNSTPVFTGTPVPYICISDTTAFSNAAIDADGDSLVFSFEPPYASQDNVGGISTPPLTLGWPLEEVQFTAGHNALQPFGAAGYANIDPVSGASEYLAPLIGNWVVAVEVKEYRNGQLIGLIRSDLQLLSTPCSGSNTDPAPVAGQYQTSYQVTAGDTLCFPLAFVDVDGDQLTFDVVGGIFDSTLTFPAAGITGPSAADSLLATQFCWPTVCAQGSSEPYHFSVLVYDNACPPGTFSGTISVEVMPSSAPPSISGQGIGCAGQTTATYCTELIEEATYAWTITGGTAVSGLDSNCVTVSWDQPGIGGLSVVRTLDGCTLQADQPINILSSSTAEFTVALDTTCLGLLVRATDISENAIASAWAVNGVPANEGADGPEFLLPFNGESVITLESTASTGCIGHAEQTIAVNPYGQLVHFSLPNVFTPNRDGVNDRFKLKTTQSLDRCFKLNVFDRWGNQVFASEGGDQGWNGIKENGEPASEGVYFYVVKMNNDSFHGHVSLMR